MGAFKPLALSNMPGHYARPYYLSLKTGEMRHYAGGYVELDNVKLANARLAELARTKKVTHVDILVGQDNKNRLTTLPLFDATPVALAGPSEEITTADHFSDIAPAAPARPRRQDNQDERLPFGGIELLLYRQQEERIANANQREADMRDQLRIAHETNRSQKEDLDKVKLDLQLRDREHQQDLRDARAEMAENAAPRGVAGALAGLPPEAVAPIMQGVMGLFGQFMGGMGAGAAGAAGAQPALGTGLSPTMQNVVKAATEIFPDEDTAMRVMVCASKIVHDPALLNQFYKLADSQPQPQNYGN